MSESHSVVVSPALTGSSSTVIMVCVRFALNCCDREALHWATSTGRCDNETVQDVMLGAVERCFGSNLLTGNVNMDVAKGGDVTGVVITGFGAGGKPEVGMELTADVTLADGSKGTPATLDYQWQIEDAVGSGAYKDIGNANSDKYTPVKEDQKKKIRVNVMFKKNMILPLV